MLILSGTYERQIGPNGMAHFDIQAKNLKELEDFFTANKTAIERSALCDDEIEKKKITLKEAKREIAEVLIYRFNLGLTGQEIQAEKKEFLDHFKIEAIKAIIYATDHVPLEMNVDQYASLVMKSYEEHGPGDAFSERIMNASGADTHKHWIAVGTQIQMFLTLLDIPESLANIDDDLIVED